VREEWADRFELLMVDEFQDTNPRQLAILRALDRGNLFTVGDELQSIYGFRHADVGLFRQRRTELAERGASLSLRRNFRSHPALLDVVNAVFSQRLGDDFTPLLAGREREAASLAAGSSDPRGERPGGEGPSDEASAEEPLVELLLSARAGWEEDGEIAAEIARGLPPATAWRQAEARLLAQRVEELVGEGAARAGEIVVLLRAVGDIEIYERALQLRGLRTLAMVGGFWGRLQTRDLLAYLRALANPLDEQALYETLASPLAGLSSDGLALLAHGARTAGRGVWETVGALAGGAVELLERMSGTDRTSLERFHARFEEERRAAPGRSISRSIEHAIEASGYREHVLALDWGERRLANVQKLLRLARRFEASEGRDLRAFLDHVDRLARATVTAEPDAPVDGVEPDAVRLMTIHAAKGLEFPVVCVADLGRATNTRMGRLLVDGPRVGISLLRLDGEKAAPALQYEELCEERRRAQAEEEDRILYVAMTRARERLLLSGALDFECWPQAREAAPPISWLAPALAGELPLPLYAVEPPVRDLALGAQGRARVRCHLSSPASVGAVLRLDAGAQPDSKPEPRCPDPGVPAPEAGSQARISPPPATAAAGQLSIPGMDPDAAGQRSGSTRPRPPERAPASDGITTLSYTALSELERCGYRYYLERVLGLPEDRAAARAPAGAGLEARARGTLVHRLLETLELARREVPSVQDVGELARELGLHVSTGEREELAGLIGRAISSPTAARLAAAQRVRREHPFAFALGAGEPLITGVMDVLADEADGGALVLDYKSDRVGAEVDLGALVERDYGVQRLLYALAVLRDGAASVEVVHWFLERPEEPVGARFSASERDVLEGRLSARLVGARGGSFAVSPRPHRALCLTCPGRAGLCSWTEAETLREDPEDPSG
jgi:ATP-dependent exoDNAse (exonuclease V) beta subunit